MTDNPAQTLPILPTKDLHLRHPGVSVGIATTLEEAAAVCLDRHHESPVGFAVTYGGAWDEAQVEWEAPSDQMKLAWNNDTDATEAGAYCLAIAAAELFLEQYAIARVPARGGADYFLGSTPDAQITDPELNLESTLRLEVSGIDQGTAVDLQYRLSRKVLQIREGGSGPGQAVVVGFALRQMAFRAA